MSSASDAAQGFLNVVVDPCLRDVGGLLFKLHTPSDSDEPTQAQLGIGLCSVVGPLRLVVYLKQNPWAAAGLGAAFLGVFVGIGYKLGKRASR